MIRYPAPLVTMLDLIDGLPSPAPSTPSSPGRPSLYSNRLLLKAPVIMIVRWLSKVHALLRVFEQPTQEMQKLKQQLYEQERFPSRWTFDQRHCSDTRYLARTDGLSGPASVAQAEAQPSIQRWCVPRVGSGTRRIEQKGSCLAPRLIPRHTG